MFGDSQGLSNDCCQSIIADLPNVMLSRVCLVGLRERGLFERQRREFRSCRPIKANPGAKPCVWKVRDNRFYMQQRIFFQLY